MLHNAVVVAHTHPRSMLLAMLKKELGLGLELHGFPFLCMHVVLLL